MFIKSNKRSFTLIEIILGLVLSTVLIGGLFEIQRQFNILQRKVEQAKDVAFARERFYAKLSQIFKHVTDCWISEGSLAFQYDHLLDHDRNFRGKCSALLHQEGELIVLTTYGKTMRQETLLTTEKNTTLLFSFFEGETNQWMDSPSKDFFKVDKKTPSLIKIVMTNPKQAVNIEFPFMVQL